MAERFTRDRQDGRGRVVYVPTDQLGSRHTHLKIEVYYSKGGMNYWHSTQEPRGYWLSLGAVEVKDNGIMETMGLGADSFGRRIHLVDAPRFSAKSFNGIADWIFTEESAIVTKALARDYHGVKAIALEAIGATA